MGKTERWKDAADVTKLRGPKCHLEILLAHLDCPETFVHFSRKPQRYEGLTSFY